MTKNIFINYAHRGASAYAPENTFSAFELGILQGANGIETDVRETKDGILVLFHDKTLSRIIKGNEQPISNLTYDELLKLDFGIHKAERFRGEKIVTLDEFLARYKKHDLTFAIELKQGNIEKKVLAYVERYHVLEKTIITSFDYDSLVTIKKLNKNTRVGFLTRVFDLKAILKIKAIDGYEICPHISSITKDNIALAQRYGIGVRAYSIKTVADMKHALDVGVHGMTINFPDKLTDEQNLKEGVL